MVPVLIDEVVVILISLHPQPRAPLLPLIPEIRIIEVRTLRPRQTLSTDHERMRDDCVSILGTNL